MKITMKNISVTELIEGYEDKTKTEESIRGYGGRLNIRPAFQREYVYKEKQRDDVVHTVRRGFPLNTMYWVVAGDGFELLDGQQRTISVCRYIQGCFPVEIDGSAMYLDNLPADKKRQILDYELSVYVCEGAEGEKLDWFKIINTASVVLTDQELRNAIYTGPWLADAKRWFSGTGAPAVQEGRDRLVKGTPNRQEILEAALDWLSCGEIENYMGRHQHDKDAQELWQYWQEVFDWVKRVFPNQDSARSRLMKGLPWGRLYNDHRDGRLNAAELEQKILKLIDDDDVDNQRGIYEYLLTGNEKTLNLRAFDEKTKLKVYEKQGGARPVCGKQFKIYEMEADHIIPWSKGGKTEMDNCQMLCMRDNRAKGGK
jgi:hypothetical protein